MKANELGDYLRSLADEVLDDASHIIAETATEYYKSSFDSKSFDGNPWAPAKVPKRTGSLLVSSANLVNSIRPAVISPERVVISAGNDKVDYAAVHNEGYNGPVQVPAHSRTIRRTNTTYDVRPYTRTANIVQRRFLGESSELNDRIHDRIQGRIDSL